jgi:hypothetical protein
MLASSLLALVACDSKQSVDRGGFTGAQRKAAERALDLLHRTPIPRRVVAISLQEGRAPSLCSVLPKPGTPSVFRLVVGWNPTKPESPAQPTTIIQATIGSDSAAHDRFRVSTYGGFGGEPEPVALKAAVDRTMLAKTVERCEALENGDLQLVAE